MNKVVPRNWAVFWTWLSILRYIFSSVASLQNLTQIHCLYIQPEHIDEIAASWVKVWSGISVIHRDVQMYICCTQGLMLSTSTGTSSIYTSILKALHCISADWRRVNVARLELCLEEDKMVCVCFEGRKMTISPRFLPQYPK